MGRSTGASADATGAPVSSAAVTDTASGPTGASRTRRAEAPVACIHTPVQENGSHPPPEVPPAPSPKGGRAAPNRAGGNPKGPAPAPAPGPRRALAQPPP